MSESEIESERVSLCCGVVLPCHVLLGDFARAKRACYTTRATVT